MRVTDDQIVRQVVAEHRVPLPDSGANVLENRVVRVRKAQEVDGVRRPAARISERRRAGDNHRRARVEHVVAERHFVLAVDVEVALHEERLARHDLGDSLERPGVVAELRAQERTEIVEIGREHARRIPGGGNASGIRHVRRQRTLILLTFEALEEEQPVRNDRTAEPLAAVGRLERAGIDGLAFRLRPDERFVAVPVVPRSHEVVRSAPRHRVDAGADEVALANVVRRHADLHLLDRFERNRRNVGSIARLRAEAERVVEIRAVDRDVVHPVVRAGEAARPAVLRRQARHVVDAAGDRRQRRELFAEHGGGRAGMR